MWTLITSSFCPSDLQHIEQDERVSMSLNGDLYFSHAVERDSRRDYCCFAAFPRIRTIVQKTAMSVIVKTSRCHSSFFVFTQVLFRCHFDLFSEHWSFPACSLISIYIDALQKPSNGHILFMCTSLDVVILILVMFVMKFTHCHLMFNVLFCLIHIHFRKKWPESWGW